jgi:hypothetical protein
MECAICFEKFLTPKSKEELEKLYKENIKNNNFDDWCKFSNLIITSKHNETHVCSTPNCECIICRDCWIKITNNGKDIMEATEDDIPSIYDYFICPYCRNIDWKYYMHNVFTELQQKVLGMEEYTKLFIQKNFPELFNKQLPSD